MSQNFTVNYNINVNSDQALRSIRAFQEATATLTKQGKQLDAFRAEINKTAATLQKLTGKSLQLKISTADTNKKLDVTIRKLERIHTLTKSIGLAGGGRATAERTTSSRPSSSSSSTTSVVGTGSSNRGQRDLSTPANRRTTRARASNLGYKIFGPSMLDTGGIGAFEMVKGMGIAYGIAGLGAWVGSIMKNYTEYDNMMKTTYNILKTHDKGSNFGQRFNNMAQTIRNVGVQTKFTAPEVADAGKFLAMAGFDLDDINKSITPIANLALIGDTELGKTADITTNIMTGYGIAAEQIGKASDIMAMTFTSSNTTLTEIAEAYKYSASLLSAGNVGFEEATAALGILGDAGIKGSQAGTTMRTIMANIVKPTSKQEEHWKKVGVNRFDENGNARDLIDIFQDLSALDLQVADFYKLFHKTAAQGAVSLTQNVDKWNMIISRNFLSDGLANRLAEEKKNTIQGLWHQLTSTFVETGMQAFGGIEGRIREMLTMGIEWAKSPEALASIKSLLNNTLDIVTHLASVAKMFLTASPMIMSFITGWAKFQIYAAPVLMFGRALKSLIQVGEALIPFRTNLINLFSPAVGARMASFFSILGPALAIGGVGAWAIYSGVSAEMERVQNFKNTMDEWTAKTFVADGYMTKGIEPSQKYLELVYDKQLSVNKKVEEYIRLRKEELGLTSKSLSDNKDKSIKDLQSSIFDDALKVPGSGWWLNFFGEENATAWNVMEKAVDLLPEDIKGQYQWQGASSKDSSLRNFYITKNGASIGRDQFLSETLQYITGQDSGEASDFIDKYTKEFFSSPLDQWVLINDRITASLKELKDKVDPNLNDLTLEQFANMPANQLLTIPKALAMAEQRILSAFDFAGDSPSAQKILGYKEFLETADTPSLDRELKFFASQGIGSFANSLFGSGKSFDELIAEMGYNPHIKQFVGDGVKSAEDYAKDFHAVFVSPIYEWLSANPESALDAKKLEILDHPAVKLALAMTRLRTGKGKDSVELDEDGNPIVTKTGRAINQDAYEQKYRSTTAAPKQVIVRIENMMNVESIDLSNPNNQAVVDNLKEQLAQTLIDVVHDFDISFNS